VAYGLAGATAATVGGYLGGHLLQNLTVGMDRTRTPRPPDDWTRVASSADVGERPTRVLVGEAPVMLLRHHGEVVALDARCPHRGGPMDEGEIQGDCIVCPWHGSTFRIDDGTLVQGPSVLDLPQYEVRVTGDAIEVRAG
jgi:nitrite reductase/ring-hydroxylating ferredoxin subunit